MWIDFCMAKWLRNEYRKVLQIEGRQALIADFDRKEDNYEMVFSIH